MTPDTAIAVPHFGTDRAGDDGRLDVECASYVAGAEPAAAYLLDDVGFADRHLLGCLPERE